MNKIDQKIRREIILKHLDATPLIPTRTLATLLTKIYPDTFPSYTGTRVSIQSVRGEFKPIVRGKDWKSTRLNSSHVSESRMPSSA